MNGRGAFAGSNAGAGGSVGSSGFGGGFGSNLGTFLGGLFGDSGSPYDDAMKEYEKYMGKAREAQNPFYNAGTGAIPQFQDWLSKMKDPSAFINNLMGGYQESPFAKFQQEQGMRAANNFGSANGLSGSTPLQMQAQQNAQSISSGDMNSWLQNVLGVNTQYGGGLNNLVQGGQNSANQLSSLYGNYGQLMGEGAAGSRGGRNQDFWNTIGGGLGLAGNYFGF
jgi:hypothetical protein